MATRQPCPGCGGREIRTVGEVCDSCATAIRIGRARQFKKQPQGISFRVSPCWPTIMHSEPYLAVEKAFDVVVRSLFAPSPDDPYLKGIRTLPDEKRVPPYSTFAPQAQSFAGSDVQIRAIDALDKAVRTSLKLAYEAGRKDGQDILGQLTRGEISTADLTEETVKAARGRR